MSRSIHKPMEGSVAMSVEGGEEDPFCPSSSRAAMEQEKSWSSSSSNSRTIGTSRSLFWLCLLSTNLWKAVGFLILGFCLGFFLPTFPSRSSSSSSGPSHLQQDTSLRFLVVGDWGRLGLYNQSQVAIQMGRVAEQLGVQFIVSTGDNFYEYGLMGTNDSAFTTSFTNVFTGASLQKMWYAVLGNHDYMGDALAQLSDELVKKDPRWSCKREFELHHSLCGEDRSKNATCKASVDMFFIDTTPFIDEYWLSPSHPFNWTGLAPRAKQLKSQLKRLASKLGESNATWKIVIGHHTIRSVGHHGDISELLSQLLPILETYDVDMYINGHDHNLQHIKRQDCSIHFVTSGGGSKAFKGLRSYNDTAGVQFVFDGQGFVAMTVEEKSFSFSFHDVFGDSLYSALLKK